MKYKLYPPGTRKNPRNWIARGYVYGDQIEISCRTPDQTEADHYARAFFTNLKAHYDKGDYAGRDYARRKWHSLARQAGALLFLLLLSLLGSIPTPIFAAHLGIDVEASESLFRNIGPSSNTQEKSRTIFVLEYVPIVDSAEDNILGGVALPLCKGNVRSFHFTKKSIPPFAFFPLMLVFGLAGLVLIYCATKRVVRGFGRCMIFLGGCLLIWFGGLLPFYGPFVISAFFGQSPQ